MNELETTPASTRRASPRPALSAKRLRELLTYDKENGEFRWKRRSEGSGRGTIGRRRANRVRAWNNMFAGQRAGYSHKSSWLIELDGVRYEAHRLAHFYMTGQWPQPKITTATTSQQTSKVEGCKWVYWDKGLWCAKVSVGGKSRHLSRHANFNEAVAAAAIALHGEFANLGAAQ